jgi:hypothetical protein
MLRQIKDKILFYLPIVKILCRQPRYLKYILVWGKSPLDSAVPWVNFATKEWLDKNLNKAMTVFEYGSGGSTLYYAKKVKKLISVEHDSAWHEIVKGQLAARGLDNVELYCLPPEAADAGADRLYFSSDEHYQGQSFQKYAEKINDYPDDFFDLVMVDGRARRGCLHHVLPQVKPGGYVLFDNSDLAEYASALKSLDKFPVQVFFGPGFYGNGRWEARLWQINK